MRRLELLARLLSLLSLLFARTWELQLHPKQGKGKEAPFRQAGRQAGALRLFHAVRGYKRLPADEHRGFRGTRRRKADSWAWGQRACVIGRGKVFHVRRKGARRCWALG